MWAWWLLGQGQPDTGQVASCHPVGVALTARVHWAELAEGRSGGRASWACSSGPGPQPALPRLRQDSWQDRAGSQSVLSPGPAARHLGLWMVISPTHRATHGSCWLSPQLVPSPAQTVPGAEPGTAVLTGQAGWEQGQSHLEGTRARIIGFLKYTAA
ncbi:hypothetical protein H1C71_006216 [Ictidomys tridecemlineatus]|nr:hypothetical protein H1C71_006216 [Ictidomys tridecemlineatus]KAG3279186.1 hypothetical protein H1C71_006216 [Ictidomys tridecemlineatus]KAG3279187.1 hypothetical protein H1C71_006216 [Ictidomys tridecemlineatus]